MDATLAERAPLQRRVSRWWPVVGHVLAVGLPVLAMVVFCAPCSGPDPSALGNLIFVTWEGLLAMVVLVSGLRAVRSGRWAAIRMTVAWWVLGLVPAVFIVAPMIENVRKVIQIMTCPLRA